MTQPVHAPKVEAVLPPLVIDLKPNTVFILCGPPYCGKSSFADSLWTDTQRSGLSLDVLSSDYFRQQLVSTTHNLRKFSEQDPAMGQAYLAASKGAFELLYTQFRAVTSFPISTDIVVIDTTGFQQSFRDDMVKIANDAGYDAVLVVFDYKSQSSYLRHVPPEYEDQVRNSVYRFRHEVLQGLQPKNYREVIRVKQLGQEVEFTCDTSLLSKTRLVLERSDTVVVISDSHECVEELEEMLRQIDAMGAQAIHLGDYLDKGDDTKRMIELMHSRKDQDFIIKANHESYVEGVLSGRITDRNPELEAQNFSSLAVILADPELQTKFLEIWETSDPFLVLCQTHGTGLPVFINHAPCESRYLGKYSADALHNQRNYRTRDRTIRTQDDLAWLYDDSYGNLPLNIFGHSSHLVSKATRLPQAMKQIRYKNRVFLDTGCVYGGHLAGLVLKDNQIVDLLLVPATKVRAPTRTPLPRNLGFRDKAFDMRDYDLSPFEMRQLGQMTRNDIQYLSGTMSPGPSTKTELEGLEAGLQYLASRGVESVVMQPKWMGSRCQAYLYPGDVEKSMLVSRNGWKIRRIEGLDEAGIAAFIQSLLDKYKPLTDEYGAVVLDGELLPWSALGRDLIDRDFDQYGVVATEQLVRLAEVVNYEVPGLEELFGQPRLLNEASGIDLFYEALERYALKGEANFKPFAMLKAELKAPPVSPAEQFMLVSPGVPYLEVNLSNNEDWVNAQRMFETWTIAEGLEGCVLKPVTPTGHEIPYMKIRSPEYLRLVYGHNYPARIEALCKQKSISGKMKASIKEAEMATRLLTCAPEERQELFVKLIGQIRADGGLDPRL